MRFQVAQPARKPRAAIAVAARIIVIFIVLIPPFVAFIAARIKHKLAQLARSLARPDGVRRPIICMLIH